MNLQQTKNTLLKLSIKSIGVPYQFTPKGSSTNIYVTGKYFKKHITSYLINAGTINVFTMKYCTNKIWYCTV